MSSRQLEDAYEREFDERVAEYIGLTYDEYISLQPEIVQISGDDGEDRGLQVVFSAPVPAALTAKLGSESVDLPPGFSEWDDEEPPPDEA